MPSRYHSARAMSAPPSRPAQRIRIPSAPKSIAVCTARFMARRKEIRRSNWMATCSATSWASVSGCLISTMSILTCLPPHMLEILAVIRSISEPLRPITRPGRAVKRVTRTLAQARSIKILDTEANCSLVLRYLRTSKSLCRKVGKSSLDAYHFEAQFFSTARRKPIGLTFCPIALNLQFQG